MLHFLENVLQTVQAVIVFIITHAKSQKTSLFVLVHQLSDIFFACIGCCSGLLFIKKVDNDVVL